MMVAQLLSSAKFCEFLFMLDRLLFDSIRGNKCPHCGGVLHTANYKRKIYTTGIAAPNTFELRFATCCSQCRKRCFVPTIRFFERRGACAIHFLLSMLFLQKSTHRNKNKLKTLLPISENTIARWRKYFSEEFPELATIKKLKSQQVISQSWFIRFFMKNSMIKASLMLLSSVLISTDELYIKIVTLFAGNYIPAKDG